MDIFDVSKQGSLTRIKEILDTDVNINAKNNKSLYMSTALVISASYNHPECVKELLKRGADIKATDTGGWTALMYASCYGYTECVLELLKYDIEVNKISNFNCTALMYSVIGGRIKCMKILLCAG